MYLILAPALTQTYTIHYQSVGREITTFSSLRALETVEAASTVILFYDYSIDIQKMLDLRSLLDLSFIVVVNNAVDYEIMSILFKCYLLDYASINGALIRAIKLEDTVAMESMQRSAKDKKSIHFGSSYVDDVRAMLVSPSANEQTKILADNFLSVYAAYTELSHRYVETSKKAEVSSKEMFSLKQALKKMAGDAKAFIGHFAGLQNKYRAITAMSVTREVQSIVLPQHLTSLYLRNYGIPNVFHFLASLYDSLTSFYKKHVKVVYIGEPNGIDINLIPQNYCLIDNSVNQADLLKFDYLACIGNVRAPIEALFRTSSFNTLIICDARRHEEALFSGETLALNLAPDIHTVQYLGLSEDVTITPSHRSKYVLKDEVITQNVQHGARNAKLVTQVVNTLLERRGDTQ